MILIKGHAEARYARTRGDKDSIVQDFDEDTDLLLWARIGQHYTDIFQLTKADLARYYREERTT